MGRQFPSRGARRRQKCRLRVVSLLRSLSTCVVLRWRSCSTCADCDRRWRPSRTGFWTGITMGRWVPRSGRALTEMACLTIVNMSGSPYREYKRGLVTAPPSTFSSRFRFSSNSLSGSGGISWETVTQKLPLCSSRCKPLSQTSALTPVSRCNLSHRISHQHLLRNRHHDHDEALTETSTYRYLHYSLNPDPSDRRSWLHHPKLSRCNWPRCCGRAGRIRRLSVSDRCSGAEVWSHRSSTSSRRPAVRNGVGVGVCPECRQAQGVNALTTGL